MDREVWLKSLKEGDDVVVGMTRSKSLKTTGKVVRVTPTGRIKVQKNNRGVIVEFDADGIERTQHWSYSYGKDMLLPYDAEFAAQQEHDRWVNAVKFAKFETLSTDQLRRIDAILKEGKDGDVDG